MTAVPVVFTITCVIAGLALLALCVVSFLQYEVSEAIDIVLPIYYGIFGVISLLAEARIRLLFKYLDFISNRIAKGFFYIFIGILCMRKDYWLNYTVTAYAIVLGVAHFIFKHEPAGYGLISSDEGPEEEAKGKTRKSKSQSEIDA